jgi:hypothetical protein
MNEKNLLLRLSLAVAAIGSLAAGCAAAPSTPAGDVAQLEPTGKTCRSVQPTGSRISERVCKSNAEWAREEAAAQEDIKRVQQSQSVVPGDGEGG